MAKIKLEDEGEEANDENRDEESNLEERQLIRVSFKSRTWGNMALRVVYKIYRVFFVSLYFYFIPFYALVLSFMLPLVSK